ncbi:hypothetical protein NG2371_03762 [Nocardia gamkensis]|nr:hypothetical protein [Nocardia gamkensis]
MNSTTECRNSPNDSISQGIRSGGSIVDKLTLLFRIGLGRLEHDRDVTES